MGDYICPYCGSRISEEDVLFVDESFEATYEDPLRFNFLRSCCKEWPFDDGNRFRGLYFHPTPDSVINRDKNGFPILLRVFPSEGLTPSELAGSSSVEEAESKPVANGFSRVISTRVCTHCHCRLPANFGIIPTIYVTMLGGRAAGKTAYLISLIHRLQTQLATLNLGTARLLPESQVYFSFQDEYYQKNGGVTMPTPKDELLFPFIFEYNYIGGGDPISCFVAIYDIAGEGLESPDYLLNHYGVQVANTVLLMLDPNQINGGMFDSVIRQMNRSIMAVPGGVAPAGGESHDFYARNIGSFLTEAVLSNRSFGVLRNVKHVIAVTTKIDQPLVCRGELFGGTCLLKEDIGTAHNGKVEYDVVKRISQELQTFYRTIGNIDVLNTINTVFGSDQNQISIDLLAVSTYSRVAGAASSKIEFENNYSNNAPKHRVIEPLLMVLARSGMIPIDIPESLPDTPRITQLRQTLDHLQKEINGLREELKKGVSPREEKKKQQIISKKQTESLSVKKDLEKEIQKATKQKNR